MSTALGEVLPEDLAALFADDGLPPREDLPWWVAPLPRQLENLGLNLVWVVVAVNLLGTAFGFWYYRFQFAVEPLVMAPLVPDSPTATLFVALAFGVWALGRHSEYLSALAFFGCWKLGLWTPFVLVALADGFLADVHPVMYAFLLTSHLAMVVEAFVLHRVADFPVRAVAVAVAWYAVNDLVDYFVGVVGTPHHTLLPGQALLVGGGGFTHPVAVHRPAAAAAVALTLFATFLALSTRVKKLETRSDGN